VDLIQKDFDRCSEVNVVRFRIEISYSGKTRKLLSMHIFIHLTLYVYSARLEMNLRGYLSKNRPMALGSKNEILRYFHNEMYLSQE
jgi:hypothetical protein